MGSSVHPPDRQSGDRILSPHLLLQFSRDFDETFQLLFPYDNHVLLRLCSTDFFPELLPLTIFQQKVLSPQLLLQFSVDFGETF